MLIRFEVSNFRSLQDAAELSMVAVDEGRPGTYPVAKLGRDLLSTVAIYGPNASGKSNLLAALRWLRAAFASSLSRWDDAIPVEPFAFDAGERPTEFVLELAIEGIRYEYMLSLNADAVEYEALFHYPEKKRRRIFEREGNELKLQRGLGVLSGSRQLLTPRSLVMSIANRFREPMLSAFFREFTDAVFVTPPSRRATRYRPLVSGPTHTEYLFDRDLREQETLFDLDGDDVARELLRVRALELLRLADLGIQDVNIERSEGVDLEGRPRARTELRLLHKTANGPRALNFFDESDGTKTWFSLIGPLLWALSRGSMLIVDEIDASLHPSLSAEVLRLFKDDRANPSGAQIIFTTHDASLLNHLNRDEVWFTEKSDDGRSHIGALSEFAGERVRASVGLERGYLGGRFGGLPDIDDLRFLRAVGAV
jgi:hypothetical protein